MTESLDDRLARRLPPGHPDYDPFYDATDDQLAAMIPPPPNGPRIPCTPDMAHILRIPAYTTEGHEPMPTDLPDERWPTPTHQDGPVRPSPWLSEPSTDAPSDGAPS